MPLLPGATPLLPGATLMLPGATPLLPGAMLPHRTFGVPKLMQMVLRHCYQLQRPCPHLWCPYVCAPGQLVVAPRGSSGWVADLPVVIPGDKGLGEVLQRRDAAGVGRVKCEKHEKHKKRRVAEGSHGSGCSLA